MLNLDLKKRHAWDEKREMNLKASQEMIWAFLLRIRLSRLLLHSILTKNFLQLLQVNVRILLQKFLFTNSCLDSPKKFVYFIGLVDILTYYGVKKRTASAAKSVKYGSEAENISTVKPDQVCFYMGIN